MRYIVLDLESHAIADAATYLTEPVDAPSNWKDPLKIEQYIKDAKQAQLDKAALDVDLARIVCMGLQFHGETVFTETWVLKDETQERTLRGKVFDNWFSSHNTADWPILVTFNGLGFDLPLLLRRALYLGVKAPNIQIDRFKHPHVLDLMDILNYSGKFKSHSLNFYCQRFGIPYEDEHTGAEIAGMVAAGDWAGVEHHNAACVQATYALAKRMGVLA
jgi:predicted PolB exonuclease-like 3'-5' exonuclease